jgi:diaminopimelate epimerase
MNVKFSKMNGLGNDFMVIDGISQSLHLTPEQIRQWADRHFGVGFDQLLLVEAADSDQAQFKYRIFNADGGEVSQCGNGARCFARFVREHGLTDKTTIAVETRNGLLQLTMLDEQRVQVDMGVPVFDPVQIPFIADEPETVYQLKLNGELVVFSAVSMGNPHAVIIVDDVDRVDLESLGKSLQAHVAFPQSVNVGVMQVINNQHFKLRVYERGAGETLACGSGACAAMAAGRVLDIMDTHATATLRGGELQLDWQGEGKPVMMTGSTEMVYEGEIKL